MLGPLISASWDKDPRHLGFMLAKYKFVAKMLVGVPKVLEIGCGDATGSRVVAQTVGALTCIDTDDDLLEKSSSKDRVTLLNHDMLDGPMPRFDAAYALDVLEHVDWQDEDKFFENVKASLTQTGIFICGSPSKESRIYSKGDPHEACEFRDSIHSAPVVNCKTEAEMRETLKRYFSNVFVFGMNDEVLHTGYGPMTHYRLAVCTI